METNRDLNVIEVSDRQFLLTATAGDAIHLTREADGEETGQAAIPGHYLEDFERTYDVAAILEPKWAERTLSPFQLSRKRPAAVSDDNVVVSR